MVHDVLVIAVPGVGEPAASVFVVDDEVARGIAVHDSDNAPAFGSGKIHGAIRLDVSSENTQPAPSHTGQIFPL